MILGLSSSNWLTSVLILETSWWGKQFLVYNLPSFVFTLINFYGDNLGNDLHNLFFFLLSISKILSQGLLGLAYLRNYSGHGQLLKAWYWIGITLDVIVLNAELILALTEQFFKPIDSVLYLVQFVFVRGGIWILATQLIKDVSVEGTTLDMDRPRTGLNVNIILAWEFVWYSLITVFMLEARFYGPAIVVLSIPIGLPDAIMVLYALTVLGALLLWVAIIRNWRSFLMIWVPMYFIFNVAGYAAANYSELTDDSKRMFYNTALAFYTSQVSKIVLSLVACGFKVAVVISSIVFIFQPEAPWIGLEYKEIQPLITSEK